MLQAPTSSAAAYVPVFEASLQQVCLGVTAGTQAGEQLQSGAGPLTLQVSRCSCSVLLTASHILLLYYRIDARCCVTTRNPTSTFCRQRASRCGLCQHHCCRLTAAHPAALLDFQLEYGRLTNALSCRCWNAQRSGQRVNHRCCTYCQCPAGVEL